MATSTDTQTNLVINRLTRKTYNELSANNQIYNDQLYLIDDENFDVCNKRVVNVNTPERGTDAVNLEYLNDYYLQKDSVIDYIDNSRIYSEKLDGGWVDGSTFIQGDGSVYTKDTTHWNVSIIKGSVGNVIVEYNQGYGWQFCIDGTFRFGQNFTPFPDTMHETTTYNGETVEVSATSWSKTDKLIRSSEIKDCLGSITENSTTQEIAKALMNLKEKVC